MQLVHLDVSGWHARFDDGFDDEHVQRIAAALGILWSSQYPQGRVLVSYDMRFDSERLAHSAGELLAAQGLDVVVSQSMSSTAALSFALAHDPSAVGGVMFSGSDLSCESGGVLLRGADGGPVSSDFIEELNHLISSVNKEERASVSTMDMVQPHLRGLMSLIDAELIAKRAPHIVVDPMFGVARNYVATVLRSLGCTVYEIHKDDSSDFEGIHPRAREPWVDDCEREVLTTKADFGLALDGDATRFALIDEQGLLISPHRMLPMLMSHVVEHKKWQGRIVTTLSSSARIGKMAALLGCDVSSVPVGFNRVYDEFSEGDVLLACEEYGGICFPKFIPERDGVLAALLTVEAFCAQEKKMSDYVEATEARIGHMHYGRRDVRLDPAAVQAFRNMLPGLNPQMVAGKVPISVRHSDGLKLSFEDNSWMLLRPSRNEPVVRVYAESCDVESRDKLLVAARELIAAR